MSVKQTFFCKISDIFVKYLKGFSKIPYVQKKTAYRRKRAIRLVGECISGLLTAANRVAPHLTGPPASLVM